jgi:D-beta-D-heptose 7-phosphate kinase / D-beta-D-heptose 1-phosphate adenosyltransferase
MATVHVIGDVMIDEYIMGDSTRVSPEAPVPVVAKSRQEVRLGGAANVACNIKALGCEVYISGLAGFDTDYFILKDLFEEAKIQHDIVQVNNYNTIKKTRIIANNLQIARIDSESLLHEVIDLDLCDNPSVLLLSDYAKGSLYHPQALINNARAKKIPVIIDPKGTDWGKYSGSTLITPNLKEWCEYSGTSIEIGGENPHVFQEIIKLNLDAILITLSEQGMMLFKKDGTSMYFPSEARKVMDVTGAGDTVVATIACFISEGYSLIDACSFANQAAGIVVQKFGTSLVWRDELNIELNPTSKKVFTNYDVIQKKMHIEKSKGKKIGFTNGCFDILHAGHVQYLSQAAQEVDILIVAINDDESTKRLKGKDRPINSVVNRSIVLAGLQDVDYVTSFSDDTPIKLIRLLKPDILMKGGDYGAVKDIVGHEIVFEYGGEVKLLSGYDDLSTTNILKKIK